MNKIITYTPTAKIVDTDKSTSCVVRTYKDGQWRQCRLQYYKLYPLIAEPLIEDPTIPEVIVDMNGMPIHIAKNIVVTDTNYQLTSVDGYLLTDADGILLTTGG